MNAVSRCLSGGEARIRLFTSMCLAATLVAAVAASAAADTRSSRLVCAPAARLFSTAGALAATENLKKLSRDEFGLLSITPAGLEVLARGTELNVLVDQACLLDPKRGPRSLPWLARLAKNVPARGAKGLKSFVWRLEDERPFEELQSAFELEPCVNLVSPNGEYQMMATDRALTPRAEGGPLDDPLAKEQEHLGYLHFAEAYSTFQLPLLVRKPVTVAVIDSGVDFQHPDLRLNRWVNTGEIAGNGADDDGNGYVDDVSGYNFADEVGEAGPAGSQPESRHGTHVAGLLGGRVDNRVGGVGIDGVVDIMSLNIFGANSSTRSALLENAIRYAADQGADVINMSLGGREYSRTMRSALDYATSRGAFIVTAAGNFGLEICEDPNSFGFVSPAVYASSIEGMMVVGSVDTANGQLSTFSNYSSRLVEILAPGAFQSESKLGLLSTVPGGGYAYMAGTSMASPIVAGAAALAISWLKVYGYASSPARVEYIMRQAARHDWTLNAWVQDGRSLDLVELANYLRAHYPPRTALAGVDTDVPDTNPGPVVGGNDTTPAPDDSGAGNGGGSGTGGDDGGVEEVSN